MSTTLHVIGSGFGRTGTLSLKQALEILGFGPCYHMEEVIGRPARIRQWHAIAQGDTPDWHDIFAGYGATVDFPASVYYRQIMDAYPQAKVIHTVRDVDRWYESTLATIYQVRHAPLGWIGRRLSLVRQFDAMQIAIIWDGLFEGRFEDRVRAKQIFEAHSAQVKAVVPSDRLLLFEVSQGWQPLCEFLGVPVPGQPFPHVNDRRKFQRQMRLLRWSSSWGLALLLLLILALAMWWLL